MKTSHSLQGENSSLKMPNKTSTKTCKLFLLDLDSRHPPLCSRWVTESEGIEPYLFVVIVVGMILYGLCLLLVGPNEPITSSFNIDWKPTINQLWMNPNWVYGQGEMTTKLGSYLDTRWWVRLIPCYHSLEAFLWRLLAIPMLVELF